MHRLEYFFPIREDYQKPTDDEIKTTYRKLVIPGLLTFAVTVMSGQELSVAIPVTLVNAGNSALTAIYRTFLGNWWRRSTNLFPSQWLKALFLGSIFSMDLYWAGAGKNIGAALSFAGWMNMFATKWMTTLFNTLWRSPLHYVTSRWEEWRNNRDNNNFGNEKTRLLGGAMEKFISYVMTQFFIQSLLSKGSLFQVAQHAGQGLGGIYFSKHAAQGDMVLMKFNLGSVVMLGVGLSYLFAVKNPALIEPGAKIVEKLEAIENKTYTWIYEKIYHSARKLIYPLSRIAF
jgi:hypothetical protein